MTAKAESDTVLAMPGAPAHLLGTRNELLAEIEAVQKQLADLQTALAAVDALMRRRGYEPPEGSQRQIRHHQVVREWYDASSGMRRSEQAANAAYQFLLWFLGSASDLKVPLRDVFTALPPELRQNYNKDDATGLEAFRSQMKYRADRPDAEIGYDSGLVWIKDENEKEAAT